jgi:hypothetical protein
MDEVALADETMRLRAMTALSLQLEGGLSQAAACREAGLDPKTYRKYIRGSDELMAIREATESALVQGVVLSLKAYLAGLERMERMVADPETAPRDLVAAMKFLEAGLMRFVAVLPQPAAQGGEAGTVIPFNFDGPVTIRVGRADDIAVTASDRINES